MSTNIKNPDGSLTKIAGKTLQYPVNTNIGTSEVLQDAPVGHIISYMGTTAPAHYLACDGSTYNISDYPKLANHFLANFGSKNYFGGNGTTTFSVPDLRGEFLRGTGTNSHANNGNGANVGVHQDATQHLNRGTSLEYTYNQIIFPNERYSASKNPDSSTIVNDAKYLNTTYSNLITADNITTFYTSRPTNTSVLYCIKAEPTYYMEIKDPGYSTDEVFTGKTWIDDKPIYRKVFNLSTNMSLQPQTWTQINEIVIEDGASQLIDVKAIGTTLGMIIPITGQYGSKFSVLNERNATYGVNGFIIEYTKTTD